MPMFIRELSNDCQILLERALLGKTIACFGIDGFGKHGHADQAQHYVVSDITVELESDSDHDVPLGMAWITLNGYDATVFGDICTDQNFKLSLNALLKVHEIRPDSWEWIEVELQERNAVVLRIHVDRLLEWF